MRFYVALFFLLPQAILFVMPYVTGDMGFWIALGRDMLAEQQVVIQDSYSVLKTTPMVYPSWGISIIYALVDKLGGIEALYIFHRLIFLVFQILIFRRIRSLHFSDWHFGALAVLAMCGATFFCDRPAMIPMIFVVIMTSLIEKLLSAPKRYFNLVKIYLLITLWANIHGSVLFSLIYVAMFVFYDLVNGNLRARYGIYLLLSLVVFIGTISTPFGVLIYPYSIETAQVSKARKIIEWNSPTLPTRETAFEILTFYFLGIFESIRRFKKWGIKSLSHPVVLSFIFGITALRNVIWFFWIFLTWLTKDNGYPEEKHASQNLSVAQKIVITCLGFLILCMAPPIESVTYKVFTSYLEQPFRRYNVDTPYDATQALIRDGKNGAIFNEFEYGGYLLYRLAGKNKIFMDGRNIIYSEEDFELYKTLILAQPGYQALLERYDFDYVMIKKRSRGLAVALSDENGWKLIYDDGENLLFTRESKI